MAKIQLIRISRAVTGTLTALILQAGMLNPAFAEEMHHFEINAVDAATAVHQFGSQSGVQILASAEVLNGKQLNRVSGDLSTDDGFQELLAGTGLSHRYVGDRAVALVASDTARGAGAARPPVANVDSDGASAPSSGQPNHSSAEPSAADPAKEAVGPNVENRPDQTLLNEEVVVTGTHLRGNVAPSSPVSVITRDDIERSGLSTVQDVLNRLPQNFAGGSNETMFAGTPDNSASGFNIGLGSGVNLRALGSGATLVLLDGRRVTPASGIADFVDVSLFPLPAVEGIEVLTDGASAIYGGDAVAGVVNVLLRKDFVGNEVLASYGQELESGMDEQRYSATIGHAVGAGNFVASAEFSDREKLSSGDKSFFSDAVQPNDVLPSQRRKSLFLATNTGSEGRFALGANALLSERNADLTFTSLDGSIFFREAETSLASLSVYSTTELPRDWELDIGVGASRAETDARQVGVFPADTELKSDQYDVDASVNGSFDLSMLGRIDSVYGIQHRNESFTSRNVLSGFNERDADRDVNSYYGELQFQPLATRAASTIWNSLSINVAGRYESYSDFGNEFTHKVGVAFEPAETTRLRGSIGTAFNPPDLGRVGAIDNFASAFTNDLINSFIDVPVEIADDGVILLVGGTDDDLEPEKADTWTVGIDQRFNLRASAGTLALTYYNVDFRGRIDIPDMPGTVLNAINLYLSGSPDLPPGVVTESPTLESVNEFIERGQAQAGFFDFFGVFAGPENVAYILDFRDKNIARTRTDGVELSATLSREIGAYEFETQLVLNRILSFDNQANSNARFVSAFDRALKPADLRGRLALNLEGQSFSTFAAVNYTDGYVDDLGVTVEQVPSHTTVDAQIQFHFGSRVGDVNRFRLALAATNLLDKDPPRLTTIPNFNILGYDPTNASALGRFLTLSFSTVF